MANNVVDVKGLKDFYCKGCIDAFANQFFQVNGPITAHAGGTQAGGQGDPTCFINPVGITLVGTAATLGDSVILPVANTSLNVGGGVNPGTIVTISVGNVTAASITVYGSGTDTINGVATATGVTQAKNLMAEYTLTTFGPGAAWQRVLGG